MGDSGGIHPDRNYKSKVGDDVDRKGVVLPDVEDFVAKHIPTESYADCSDDEESSVPSRKCIGFVVDGDQ